MVNVQGFERRWLSVEVIWRSFRNTGETKTMSVIIAGNPAEIRTAYRHNETRIHFCYLQYSDTLSQNVSAFDIHHTDHNNIVMEK
jgi:hypothetical protein